MRLFLLAYLLLCGAFFTHAQDTIVRRNGDEIKAQVLAITPTEVTYVPTTDPPSTDTLHLLATEVFLVRHADGTKELINKQAPALGLGRTPEERYIQGREDAQKYFKASGAFWGTLGATIISVPIIVGRPIVGVLGGGATIAAIASSPPKDKNLIVPDKALLSDPSYIRGYKKQAQRKKLGNAAAGAGVGIVSGTVIWIALIVAFSDGAIHF